MKGDHLSKNWTNIEIPNGFVKLSQTKPCFVMAARHLNYPPTWVLQDNVCYSRVDKACFIFWGRPSNTIYIDILFCSTQAITITADPRVRTKAFLLGKPSIDRPLPCNP